MSGRWCQISVGLFRVRAAVYNVTFELDMESRQLKSENSYRKTQTYDVSTVLESGDFRASTPKVCA